MSEISISSLRFQMERAQSPYRIVRRDAIEYLGRLDDGNDITAPYEGFGKNVYKVNGIEVLVNDFVSKKLDAMIGLSSRQKKVVKAASGESGLRDFRNYLATATSFTKPVAVALIANPASRTVSGIVPIQQEEIPADAFFDFLEMFMEENRLVPVRREVAYDAAAGLTVYMDSMDPQVRQIAPGEDFRIDSYFLRWNVGRIELGRYYERLICSNGQTATISQSEAQIHSLQPEVVKNILEIPNRKELLDNSFDRFTTKALEAMEVRASMAELKLVSGKLDLYLVDRESSSRIAPYTEQLQLYADSGYRCDPSELREMKAGMSVWDLYNG
ncbi:MAG: hypothetical protein IK145_01720, partial [Bacteroidales bacterium]|nr:hypothetical protein [Bacteroidales bacterium]